MLYIIYNIQIHQFMDCLYKTASTVLYTCKLVPAQRLSLLPKHPSFPPKTAGDHIRTDILAPTCSVFPLIRQSTYKSALCLPLLCYMSFPQPQSLSVLFIFTCTSAESRRCNSEGMLINFSHPRTRPSHTDSLRILAPLQHCGSTMRRFVCVTPSKTHTYYCRFSCISAVAC